MGSSRLKKAMKRARENVHPNSNIAKRRRERGVRYTEDLKRILELPHRAWDEEHDLDLLIDEVTDWLRQPTGAQRLRPVQAAALTELHDYHGLFGVILVGGGKTHISWLAPMVLESQRPILLVPAALRDKTKREFKDLSRHWQGHHDLDIVSYEKLGRVNGAKYLDERRPDLIIADECHKLKNRDAAVTRRVEYWMEDNPDTAFCALSGTITKRSLLDFHHLLKWTHGGEHMPLPFLVSEAMEWAQALDEKPEGRRRDPGALHVFVTKKVKTVTRTIARQAFGDRLKGTPAVIATKASAVDASLVGSTWEPKVPDVLRAHIDHLKNEWETPSGDVCRQPVDLWRHARELVCGFYYEWNPKAPEKWMLARRAWFRYVREKLAERIPGLDSPMQVAQACKRGNLHSGQKYERWQEVKDAFKPNNVPVWVDTSVLQQVVDRIPRQPTLVWVEQVATGNKLAELSGLPFYSRQGRNADGAPIEELAGKGSAILSISSNHQGRNLQAWNRNMIVSPPPNGGLWEQLIGRTHREGQEADEVFFDIMFGDAPIRAGMRQALRDAQYIQDTTRTPQKLLLAGLQVTEPSLQAA